MRTMLPEEASKQICPLQSNERDDVLCCEVRCMAWQFYEPDYHAVRVKPGFRPKGLGWVKRGPRDGEIIWTRRRAASDRYGFCGAFTKDRMSFHPAPIRATPISGDDVEPISGDDVEEVPDYV